MEPLTPMDFYLLLGLFTHLAGFVVGLGSVTVIDLHGFLGRTSAYWTEATTRTHKVTKPLIWLGTFLTLIGGVIFYRFTGYSMLNVVQLALIALLMLNGLFLSFSVSPYMLSREQEGRSSELLPKEWQQKITLSFVFSIVGWWGTLLITVLSLVGKIN